MLKSKNGWYPNQGQPLKAEYVEVQYENGETDIALASDFVWDKSYSDEYYRITKWRHVTHEPKKVILADNGGKVNSALDSQVAGDHYKKLGQYQPWEVLQKWMTRSELRGFMKGTVIAYLAREADKGADQDIAKALHTMQIWTELDKQYDHKN